jgi:hypothetical protein
VTIEGIIGGLIALGIGLAFAFYGFRLFIILLPIWGFFAGFVIGAGAMTALFGEGFLVTITSWVAGLVVGIIFAALSYLYYWFAVIFVGASLGFMVGEGLMALLNIGDGFLTFLVGVIVAVAFALAFIFLRVPKYLVLVATSFGGAFAAIAGVALLLGIIPLSALAVGTIGAYAAHVGTVASAISGYLAIAWLLRLLRTHSYRPFVLYRYFAGAFVLLVIATGVRSATFG